MKLFELFEMIKSKNDKEKGYQRLVAASTGRLFEDNVFDFLTDDSSYIPAPKSKLKDHKHYKELKKIILRMDDPERIIKNTKWREMTKGKPVIIREPYGSQSYPDFLIMTDDYIVPLEIKFSTKDGEKPVWNSSLPRESGFYLFGSYILQKSTFFRGFHLLTQQQNSALMRLFDVANKTISEEYEVHPELKDLNFDVYLRKMYNQKKSLFNGETKYIENEVIKFLREIKI